VRRKLADLRKLERELRIALHSCDKELRKQTTHCPILRETTNSKPGVTNEGWNCRKLTPRERVGGALCGRRSRNPCLGLLPWASCSGCSGFERRMDREPHTAWTVPSVFHFWCSYCSLVCGTGHLSTGADYNPGEVCAVPKTRRIYKVLFVTVSVLVLIALVFPYLVKFFYW